LSVLAVDGSRQQNARQDNHGGNGDKRSGTISVTPGDVGVCGEVDITLTSVDWARAWIGGAMRSMVAAVQVEWW
jgi:hypothetical protein